MPEPPKGSAANPTRVLIYRLGSLGDTLIALPAFHLVARAFPNAERRLLTNFPVTSKAPLAAAILEHTGLIDGFFRYTAGIRSPIAVLSLGWSLARWRPQVLVYLGTTRGVKATKRDELFFRACGIQTIVGLADTEDKQRPRAGIAPENPLLFEPEASRLVRNLAELGEVDLDDPSNWDLHLTQQEKERAAQALEPLGSSPFIVISLGTKMPANDWGEENWHALLNRIAMLYPSYALVLSGAKEDSAQSLQVAEGWTPVSSAPVLNLCGVLSPRESGAVFANAAVFIGHDSGPGHLASAVQTPCITISSARNQPGIWFPYGKRNRVLYHAVECRGCRLETCIVEKKKCIASITVDEVLVEVTAILPTASTHVEVR
jgi:heptosyltransferase-3